MALKNLLGTRQSSPYFRPPPIKISILSIVDSPNVISWDFGNTTVRPAVIKNNKVAVMTDGETCSKFTIYEQIANKIMTGRIYIVRGHELRGSEPPYFFNVTTSTMFFRTTDMDIAQELHQEAEAMLHPQAPVTHLSECTSRQGLVTVEGQVAEASFFSWFLVLRW